MSKDDEQRGGFVHVGDFALDLPGVQVPARRQARHFTQLDQVTQLVGVRDADPDLGFMARLLALCSLPRTDPKNRLQYVRRNGPYALVMVAGGLNKLPYGNIPRLLLAWVCTEAVRTQSRELVLGASLSEFMDKLGMAPVWCNKEAEASLVAGRSAARGPCREPHPSPVSGGQRADPLSHRQMRILSMGIVGWPRTDVWSAAPGGVETESQFRDGRRRALFSPTSATLTGERDRFRPPAPPVAVWAALCGGVAGVAATVGSRAMGRL